ncbi:bacteriocin-like protein [Chryseobacterium oryctis]|uniref:Bacteriocin-type signal sequence-containing protein n=1 Tax=Chryseobacterium oryctis TaxID=2952618 RepID=A0ABT3HR36_9FLAO|nr:hypothetical protein [Chryseobacterium oryctis]MCW3162222.1 hypothetical protein [Chryseobacterium oryctis]
MKKLKKVSRKELGSIIGGNAPACGSGYRACIVGWTDNDIPIWDCIPSSSPCKP